MVKWIEKLSIALNRLSMIVAGIAVMALMLLASLNVILRIAKAPFSGTYEIVGFLGAFVIAFALGETQRRKDHIVVDIMSSRFPPRVNRVLDTVQSLATLVFFSVMTWQIFAYGIRCKQFGELSETLKIGFHPFVFCVGAGFALLVLNLFADIILMHLKRGNESQ